MPHSRAAGRPARHGWDGGRGASTYADPENRLTGILLTQVGMSVPDPARVVRDFWTTLYQAIDD